MKRKCTGLRTHSRWSWSSCLEDKDLLHLFTYNTFWGGQTCTGCLKDEHKINLLVVVPIRRHTKVNLPAAFQTALQFSHPGPAHRRSSWQTQTPLRSCGCASTRRENWDREAGCNSRERCLPAAAQCARLHHLEDITYRCLLLTQLSRVQLTCNFCSFQPKVAPEATLGRGRLKQLVAVCSMWIITHPPQQSVSSLPDSFTAANTENPAKGASEEK